MPGIRNHKTIADGNLSHGLVMAIALDLSRQKELVAANEMRNKKGNNTNQSPRGKGDGGKRGQMRLVLAISVDF